MKNKKFSNKLSLSKSTIANLGRGELTEIKGGTNEICQIGSAAGWCYTDLPYGCGTSAIPNCGESAGFPLCP